MADLSFLIRGPIILSDELVLPRASELAVSLVSRGLSFVRLVECRREPLTGREWIIFDVDVERPQRPVNDIQRVERIAVMFDRSDENHPDVRALRSDFPLLPHMNLRDQEFPRSLCVDERPWDDAKLTWTAPWFIEEIRSWLARSARGELHAEDQPLEPLLLEIDAPLVFPADLFAIGLDAPAWLTIQHVDGGNGRAVYIADLVRHQSQIDVNTLMVGLTLRGEPQTHGVVRRRPNTIAELHDFLDTAGLNLVDELRRYLRAWPMHQDAIRAQLVILVDLPKRRTASGNVESHDYWAFLCNAGLGGIGEDLGIWSTQGDQPRYKRQGNLERRGENISLSILIPMPSFSDRGAAVWSGKTRPDRRRVVAIGLGALGSQVHLNLVRMGFGAWTLVDKDYLLPHNLARHALSGVFVGRPKAESLALLGHALGKTNLPAKSLVADVLHPESASAMLDEALQSADLILDMSASIPVARRLANDVCAPARRVALFLNPCGSDLVLLAEGGERPTPIDTLEMQYYREVLRNPVLAAHLKREDERIRYAHSCRDVSVVMPQDRVAAHAAIASRAVLNLVDDEADQITIWHADPHRWTIDRIDVRPSPMVERHLGRWTLRTDIDLITHIRALRQAKLPNETGGVLIGAFDLLRHLIYVVDALPAPADSLEWPKAYIRGSRGLRQRVEEIGTVTAGMLEYVGEWHSHPDGHGVMPSSADRAAFAWFAQQRLVDGLPPLMLIVGAAGELGWYLDQFSTS